ncbi:MAG: DUF4340 domain-containing protein [Blastocatellia bacterium]|nr:DUF4340 domain-containing protein [Blastocatellia bacterium]
MKKSTLILLLIAAIAGAAVYYLEYKPGKPRDEEPDKTKPAFGFTRDEIFAVSVTKAGQTVNLENKGDKWLITQPVSAPADDSAVNALIADIVSARIERELNASAEDARSYGLGDPAVRVEIKLKNGQTRKIELGQKDVLGSSVYARIDGGAKVALLPAAMLTSSDKGLKDLRDLSLLGATQFELSGLKIANDAGGFELAKNEAAWTIASPTTAGAGDESAINGLLTDLTSAKAADVVSETADDAAKYGLDKAKLSVTAKLAAGGERTLALSAKVDEKYYAKASDRPQIYLIDAAFHDKVNTKLGSLRSKEIVKIDRDQLKTISIKNPNGLLVAENKDGNLLVVEPKDKKDKEAQAFKIFTPFESKASEILDKPSAAILAKLAKPAVEVRLTYKDGKTTVIKYSAADGDDCYVRVEGRPEIFKISKLMLESLSFKIEEAIQE